jgi:hypothetical protein
MLAELKLHESLGLVESSDSPLMDQKTTHMKGGKSTH